MTWPWQMLRRSRPTPSTASAPTSRHDIVVLNILLEHARAMAAWHEARTDAFERKASTLLGFVAVVLVLLPTLRAPIAKAHEPQMRMFLVGLAIFATVLLALAAMAAAMVLKPRTYATPSLPQLRREWSAYVEQAHRTPEQLTGLLVDQFIRRTDPESSPLETLRDDAETRARWMTHATRLMLVGVSVLACLTSLILIKGGA